MNHLKEFFNQRVLINSMVFALPLSLLFMWRFTHLRGIAFFSADSATIFMVFMVVNYVVLLSGFFLLYWLSKGKQEADE